MIPRGLTSAFGTPSLEIGQILLGNASRYTIQKKIREGVWIATNPMGNKSIVKGVQGISGAQNEHNVLRKFQGNPFLRPVIDEIQQDAPMIVLQHMDDHLLNATIKKPLTNREIRFVARAVLRGLSTLHKDGYVHTDIKPDNILVNYASASEADPDLRFSDVQIGDLGASYSVDSDVATKGFLIGAPIWTSPEVLMEVPWGTASDIWAFGSMMIALLHGGDYNPFRPTNARYHDRSYIFEVLRQQSRRFGAIPETYLERARPGKAMAAKALTVGRKVEPLDFRTASHFINRIMRMDAAERPTADQLLEEMSGLFEE
ncbi:serine/threonine protein kinase [Colletotrichum lupini]|nr:serine/threonine protein kinase [Colletotrichum lupini]